MTAQRPSGHLLKHSRPPFKRLVLVKPFAFTPVISTLLLSVELASRLKVANADSVHSIAGEIQALNKRLTEATGRLPSYDQRQNELVCALRLILMSELTKLDSNLKH